MNILALMTLVEGMKYKYQLILIGTLGDLSERIKDLFFDKVEELKLSKDTFVVITNDNFESDYRGNQPTFAIYFGDDSGRFQHLDILQRLICDGTIILPVYFKNEAFHREIPCNIHGQNGLLYDSTKDEQIVNLALESFELLRSSRKVFVSYKRSESSSIAIQLYEALERSNFDVFLDTHSIKQGEPFQEELWHRMTDSDVIVLLNTKGFLDSKWCKEEIAEASVKQIGIIQMIWPDHTLENTAEICYPIQLKKEDFEDEKYTDKDHSKFTSVFLAQLVQRVESVRARNLAARQDNLITEFTNVARKVGKNVNLQPYRYISEELNDDTKRIFIPTVGIPLSINCHQSHDLKNQITEHKIDSVHLIYDDLRIREKWLKHLDWLNEYLDVKTIKKQEFEQWLRAN